MDELLSLANELRGFAEGSEPARASLMREAAEAIERLSAEPDRPATWARCSPKLYHSKSAAYAAGYDQGWRDREERGKQQLARHE